MDAPLVLELTIIIRKAHQATQVPNLTNLLSNKKLSRIREFEIFELMREREFLLLA